MSQQVSQSVSNNFTKGLITTASGLNFPEQAVTETFDCVFNLNGTVERRPGFDFEQNYDSKSADTTAQGNHVGSFLWRDVAGDGTSLLLVVQVGSTLFFYDASTTDPLSFHSISATIDLTDFSPAGGLDPSTEYCQFASGNGLLFVVHPFIDSFSVSFDPNTQTFTTTQLDLKIRDFKGIADSTPIDTRTTVGLGGVTSEHHYNLLNQGWTATNLSTWDSGRSDLPSDCDVMWTFKNSSDVFDIATIPNVVQGNSPAPKGHYILNLYNQDRFTASGINVPSTTSGDQRASAIAFFAGRLFYSGINAEGYNSNIYFTQIVERDEQYSFCYQANDPTAETVFDLLPSDGGVIVIQDAGNIIKMVPVVGGLAVFATNGVWLISGSTGLGFTANDYSVQKISSIRALTAQSFVDIAGTISWWNLEGIYVLQPTSAGGAQVNSLTDGTIREFFEDIPPSSKRHAKGYHNTITGVIQWLFKSTDSGTVSELFQYDRILNYNVFTQAFYPWTISTSPSTVFVHDLVVIENLGGTVTEDTVIDDASETIVDDAGDIVTVFTINDGIVIPKFKYLTSFDDSGTTKITFSETLDDVTWMDWSTINTPQDYSSYFISAYILRGAGLTKFQPVWVNIYSQTDQATKFDFQGIWDFALNSSTNRFTSISTINISSTDYFNGVRRLKIRGHGKVLQYKISSSIGFPFIITGWSSLETKNSLP